MMRLDELQLQITHERYHFLKFILEGYDGLCLLSSVPKTIGRVCIRYPKESKASLFSLLASLGHDVQP